MRTCAFCGKPAECVHHLIFGTGLRALADQDGLTMDLCNEHHNMGAIPERIHDNPSAERLSKMLGEYKWMLNQVASKTQQAELEKEFRMRYGRSWI